MSVSYNLNTYLTPCVKNITTKDVIISGPEGIIKGEYHFEVWDFENFLVQEMFSVAIDTDLSEKAIYRRTYKKATKAFTKWHLFKDNNFDSIKINGDINATQNIITDNNLIVKGTSNFTGAIDLKSTFSSTGDISTEGNISTQKNSIINQNLTVKGTSNFTGNINANSANIDTTGIITGGKVRGAVWNDLADAIEVPEKTELIPGKVYITYENGDIGLSQKTAQKGILGIHSDTAGFIMGDKQKKQINVAVAGFVLAYTDKVYPIGTPLTCTKNGNVTKANWLVKVFFPERIIGTFWKNELQDKWYSVNINNRNWIKIK